jgi:hypothetical protein
MQRVAPETQRRFERSDRYDFSKLESQYVDFGRVYTTPEGKRYPSITTVLGNFDKEWLQRWKDEVGEEAAAEIGGRAAARGTRIHAYAEDYLTGKMLDPEYVIWGFQDHETFLKLKAAYDENLGRIHALESTLYSDDLQMAGRCDLIADWDGEEAIVDNKTSAKEKHPAAITNYFAQIAGYSLMVQERTGRKIDKLVVAMPCDELKACQVFTARRDRGYVKYLADARKKFREDYGI